MIIILPVPRDPAKDSPLKFVEAARAVYASPERKAAMAAALDGMADDFPNVRQLAKGIRSPMICTCEARGATLQFGRCALHQGVSGAPRKGREPAIPNC